MANPCLHEHRSDKMTEATSLAAVLLLIMLASSSDWAGRTALAQSDSVGGGEQSFKAGTVKDPSGRPIGGTEIVHLVSHKGRLYAGNGYWMDTRGYANIPWSQVLVLESPEASWQGCFRSSGRADSPIP